MRNKRYISIYRRRQRQTEGQRDRETERQRETKRQRERQRERERERQTDRQRDRQRDRQTDRQADTQTDKQLFFPVLVRGIFLNAHTQNDIHLYPTEFTSPLSKDSFGKPCTDNFELLLRQHRSPSVPNVSRWEDHTLLDTCLNPSVQWRNENFERSRER